jgi:predicted DNA-binding transcriptional regulator YafY
MKADRLLSALLLLQAHGRLSGRMLARRLEVSMRTVHRDMEALSAAGVPVYALRGARGGWQLEEGWRTRVPGLDRSELRALLMAQPRSLGDARLIGAAERALEKLLASLPAALREEAASMRKRLHVDTTAWWGASEDLSKLPVVQEAVASDRKLRIAYQAARPEGAERAIRVVDPLGLVVKGGVWYLVAGTTEGLRTYRLSRIEEAAVLAERCARPARFDLAAYWKSSTEELRQGRGRYAATLRLAPSALRSLERWRPSRSVAVGAEPMDAERWATRRVQFDDEEQACFVVLGFGSRAEVMAPASLRERVAAEIDRMAAARA